MSLPPLAAEDHVCAGCGVAFTSIAAADSARLLTSSAAGFADAVAGSSRSARAVRPDEHTWSVAEYVCHVRDVLMTSTIRLHRVRVENGPVLEPMYNDLRARRFRYRDADVDAVLAEMSPAVRGLIEEIERTEDWTRAGTRLPGESRTALWVVRNAIHELTHHAADVDRVARQVRGRS